MKKQLEQLESEAGSKSARGGVRKALASIGIVGGLVAISAGLGSAPALADTPSEDLTGSRTEPVAAPSRHGDDTRAHLSRSTMPVRDYVIQPGAVLSPGATADEVAIWEIYVKIATPAFINEHMSTYETYNNPNSNVAASVSQDSADPSKWQLEVNLAWASDKDLLTETLIHEFAHVLSLNTDEVDLTYASCEKLELWEGCPQPDSQILGFYENFWEPYGDAAPPQDNYDWNVADAWYATHESDYVSNYAAMNIVEDYAETWAAFVVTDVQPTGDTVLADKFEFLWTDAEQLELRKNIRIALGFDVAPTPTPGTTVTPTATPTATATPTPTATATTEPTATATTEPTSTATTEPTATATTEPTATSTPGTTITVTPSPSTSASASTSATPTETAVAAGEDTLATTGGEFNATLAFGIAGSVLLAGTALLLAQKKRKQDA